MRTWNRSLVAALSLIAVIGIATPAVALPQLGIGLHYLRTLEEIEDGTGGTFSQNDIALLGSITIPIAIIRIEGDVEWVPDYFGENLWQPSAFGFVKLGLLYGGAGIGIGYLTGDLGGWASNPWYALRAGIEFGLGPLALDGFASYRFQSASFLEGASHVNLDALTFGVQAKFGG